VIVDTNVLIRLMQGDERAIETIRSLERRHVSLTVSSMTLFELYHSVERVSDASERRRRIEAVLDSRPTYAADDAVMKKAGRLDGRLTGEGREIGIGDSVVAATALVHEEPVLTENVEHFERIDGLEVEPL
jgi:tRNA(fMet)-specific endonuclease VapC